MTLEQNNRFLNHIFVTPAVSLGAKLPRSIALPRSYLDSLARPQSSAAPVGDCIMWSHLTSGDLFPFRQGEPPITQGYLYNHPKSMGFQRTNHKELRNYLWSDHLSMEMSHFTNRSIDESFPSIFFKRHCLQLRFVTFPEFLVMQTTILCRTYIFRPSPRFCFDSSLAMISLTLSQRATAQDLWSKIKVGRLCAMKPIHSAPVS